MPRISHTLSLWLAFIGLSAIWGSSFYFIKVGLEHGLGPLTLVTWRVWIAVATLLIVFRLTGGRLPSDRRVRVRLAVLAVINIVIPFGLITWGELWIPSAVASILNGLAPLFTIVLAGLVLHDEPITVNRLVGLVVGFGGAFLLLSRNLDAGAAADGTMLLVGELAVALAAVSYAAAGVFIRRKLSGPAVPDEEGGTRPLRPVEIGLGQTAIAAATLLPIVFVTEAAPRGAFFPPDPDAWIAVLWLGVLGSAMAYLLFFRIIASWGATRTSLVTYLLPVVGILLGVIVLGEQIDLRILVGTVLIVGGIALVNSRIGGRTLYARRDAATAAE